MATNRLRLFAVVDDDGVDVDVSASLLALIGGDTVSLQSGTLAAPPATLAVGEVWIDTTGTGGDVNPILRINLS